MFESRSALGSYRTMTGVPRADGHRALVLGELAGTHLMQMGAYPGGAARCAAAVQPILGELPVSPVLATRTGDQLLMRISPDQYWVASGEAGTEARLRNAIPSDAGCLTSLDGARTRMVIEGQQARALLSRLVAIDLHPSVFPVHGFAQTGIHHVGGLLLRAGEDRYEFFALRTYAASTWEVLLDAAHPLGYRLELPEIKQ